MKYSTVQIFITLALLLVSIYTQAQTQAQEKSDSISLLNKHEINIVFGKQDYNRFVGNTDVVKGDELTNYPAMSIKEALAGKLSGVFMLQNNGNVGEENFNLYIRGNYGGYIILVDDIERSLTCYDVEQIAEVRVLKDPVSKSLYAGRTCNGVILITTKRGKQAQNLFKATAQKGVKIATALPKFMNSYDYAINYNKALMNDNNGVLPAYGSYSQDVLDAYQSKSSPIQYPDVDYYGQFLRNYMDITRVTAEYSGGNSKTNFYVYGGTKSEGNYENYGNKKRNYQTFNLQGNVNSQFSDEIKLQANIATSLAEKQFPGNFNFITLSTRYPNSYPIFIKDGTDTIGGTSTWMDNPYGGQALSGYQTEKSLRVQADLGLSVNLKGLLNGLTWNPKFSFDIFHLQNLSKINSFGVYKAKSFGFDETPTAIQTLREETKATVQSLGANAYQQRWTFTNTFNYDRKFGNHEISTNLFYFMSQLTTAGDFYDYKRQNIGLKVNYTFKEKYSLEGVANYSGSQIVTPDKRYKIFPSVGAGWTVSNEDFLKDNNVISFLKLNASWGIMGDDNMAPDLWRETWYYSNSSVYTFNTSASGNTTKKTSTRTTQLDWPLMREVDYNIETRLFNSIDLKVSYFDYLSSGQISNRNNLISAMSGGSEFLPQSNYGQTGLTGYEAQVSYSGRVKDFNYSIGGNFTYGKTKKIVTNELPDPNYTTIGDATDDIRGYHAIGFYSQEDINDMLVGTIATPTYMFAKDLKVGNIKYQDVNGDKLIDQYDKVVIGNTAPRIMYQGNLKLEYKGIELYAVVLGYGNYKPYLSNYFQNYTTRKYSSTITEGLPNGNVHPLLTAGSGTNDYQQISDYWTADASFLKLQNVSLSYSLPKQWVKKISMNDFKLSLYGTDLFTISKIKSLDPESFDAGVNNYPLFSTYAIGLSMSF